MAVTRRVRVKTRDIPCEMCGAQRGERCTSYTGRVMTECMRLDTAHGEQGHSGVIPRA